MIRKQSPESEARQKTKNHFFQNLAHSASNIGEVFRNVPSGHRNDNFENLIKTLKKYLEDNKIKVDKLFYEFDRNRDGSISFNEFCLGFERIGLSLCVGDFLDVFRHFDIRGVGSISIESFYETLFGKRNSKSVTFEKPQLLEGKTVQLIEDYNEQKENEKVFELLTSMKKYAKLKTIPIHTFYKFFEDNKQEDIDFSEFLNLLERMDFLITRGESKKVFDFLGRSEMLPGKKTIKWTMFYDFLTESIDIKAIKKAILSHLQENRIDLREFYNNYDQNKDGTLNFEEFKLFLNEMIPELNFIDIYELYLDIDKTRDDKISYEEFERFLLGKMNSYALFDTDLRSDIKFVMNFLRKSLKNKNMSPRLFFESYIELDQNEIPVKYFQKVSYLFNIFFGPKINILQSLIYYI